MNASKCTITHSSSTRLSYSIHPLVLISTHPRQAALDFQIASEEVTRQARNLKGEFEKEAAKSQVGL
jgi:hypothetical protein